MIDTEAQKLRFLYESDKKGFVARTVAAAAVVAAGVYFGRFYTGWIGIPKTEELYLIREGEFLENTWVKQDGAYQYADKDARISIGITPIDGELYAFGPDGRMMTGWLRCDKGYMYMGADGKASRGFTKVDSSVYYFDPDGIMQTGWLQQGKDKYYLDNDGRRASGWKEIDSKRYYFDPEDGRMRTGWIQEDGIWYLLADSGEMLTGDQDVGDKSYRLNEDGTMFTGWLETDDGMRYYTDSGEAAIGWTEIDGSRYYFDEDYLMQTGSLELDDGEYYLDEDGAVSSGWHESDDGDFFVCDDGYVLDVDKKCGDFGRLVIRSAEIDVAVYTTDEREGYQSVVDEENSAVAIKERHDLEYVIADRRSQGFELDEVKKEDKAYLLTRNGSITEYVCTRVCSGENDGEDVVDDEGVSLWNQNEDGLCTYSSAGSEDKSEIIAAFWQIESDSDEES